MCMCVRAFGWAYYSLWYTDIIWLCTDIFIKCVSASTPFANNVVTVTNISHVYEYSQCIVSINSVVLLKKTYGSNNYSFLPKTINAGKT